MSNEQEAVNRLCLVLGALMATLHNEEVKTLINETIAWLNDRELGVTK